MEPLLMLALFVAAPAAAGAGCEVVTTAAIEPAAADADRALEACRAARTGFAQLFGDPVPPVRVVLWERSGYRTAVDADTAVVFWPAGGAGVAAAGDPAMLPHEIAHVLLAGRFYGEAGAASGEYGTPLADWLEEGVAIWAEPPAHRDARLATARALPPERRDLRAILATPHPAAADPAVLGIRDGDRPPPSDALWDFYPQSIAVLSFVFDRGGAAAVRELTDRIMADPDESHGLAGLAGLPGLPSDRRSVVREWERWMGEADRSHSCSLLPEPLIRR